MLDWLLNGCTWLIYSLYKLFHPPRIITTYFNYDNFVIDSYDNVRIEQGCINQICN